MQTYICIGERNQSPQPEPYIYKKLHISEQSRATNVSLVENGEGRWKQAEIQ